MSCTQDDPTPPKLPKRDQLRPGSLPLRPLVAFLLPFCCQRHLVQTWPLLTFVLWGAAICLSGWCDRGPLRTRTLRVWCEPKNTVTATLILHFLVIFPVLCSLVWWGLLNASAFFCIWYSLRNRIDILLVAFLLFCNICH